MIVISFAIFIGLLWLMDDLNWYEYQSDYYKEGTVIDKTTIGHQVGYEMYLTVEFDDGTVCTYRPQVFLLELAIFIGLKKIGIG